MGTILKQISLIFLLMIFALFLSQCDTSITANTEEDTIENESYPEDWSEEPDQSEKSEENENGGEGEGEGVGEGEGEGEG